MKKKKVKISTGLKNLLKKKQIKTAAKFQDHFENNPEKLKSYLSSFDNALVVEISCNHC